MTTIIAIVLVLLFCVILQRIIVREWLRLKPNNIYYWGIGENPKWWIDGDFIPWFLSIIPIIRPFNLIKIKLKWEEWNDDLSKIDDKIGNTIGGNKMNDPKYTEKMKLDGGFIGTREEWVRSLLKLEYVSYYVKIISSDGYGFHLIISFFLEPYLPMKVIKRPVFKMLGKEVIETLLPPWAYKKSVDDIKNTNVDLIKDATCGISMAGKDLVTYLNENHFNEVGVRIKTPFLKIIEDDDTKAYFALLKEKTNEEKRGEIADVFATTREKERISELADAKQIAEIAELNETSVIAPAIKFIKALYKGKKSVAAEQKILLVRGHEDETGNDALTEIIKRMPKPGDTTSSNKFKKEEVENATA